MYYEKKFTENSALRGLFIGIGTAGAGFSISTTGYKIKAKERSVSVKSLAEHMVDEDLTIINFTKGGVVKVIALIGSPQGMKGRTGSLVKEVLEAAQQAGAETNVFSLGDLVVQPCKGCQEICHKTGTCHQKDDFEKIKSAMLEAEGIIFATPNYTMQVSAQMKALIDRCNLLLHCQRLKGKYGAVVVTSGGSDPEVVVNYLESVITHYGFWKLGSISAVRAQLDDADEKARLTAEAKALGTRMVTAIKNKQRFPEQEEDLSQAFEIMKFMVMMLKEEWPYAWNYWNTHWELKEEKV